MTVSSKHHVELPPDQQAIRDECSHPSGGFVEFTKEEVEQSIPQRFEKIVRRHPGRLAVKSAEHAVTYAELNAIANRIARAILSKSLAGAEPVGILLGKGIEQVATMIGVLKLGKFFVLLDPEFPQSRITSILEDSGTRLVISDDRHVAASNEAPNNDLQRIMFESIDDRDLADDLPMAMLPSASAYLVYTSGSTGQPKAVIQTHRNLLHRVMLHTRDIRANEQDRMALLPSGTSNAITHIFIALLTGATLCPFDVKKEGVRRLANWLMEEKISLCLISSNLFRSLCQSADDLWKFPDLRVLRLISESGYNTDVELFRKHFSSSCILIHGLSSSETGPLCTYFIRQNTETPGNELPVGYALEGKEIVLRDDEGRELGFNEIGEIVVRSRYLSPGYWRRPDLTEAKFKSDPHDSEKRLYYTRDLGLMLPDGCLIHKGRKDFRVKIRGYGVELGEVEKELQGHPGVSAVVVVARHNEPGEATLVAYCVRSIESSATVSELRRYLRDRLPDYMLPSWFVMLDSLPLTPGGKVDRRALPEPGNTRPELGTPYESPRTAAEAALAAIWAEVLGINPIGIQDNFFDLGGHSLAASRVIFRVIQTFRLELPIKALFDAPTVAEMAAIITQNQTKRAGDTELAQMLREVEAMTEEEAQKQLARESARASTEVRYE